MDAKANNNPEVPSTSLKTKAASKRQMHPHADTHCDVTKAGTSKQS
jgi:hypothetical protein